MIVNCIRCGKKLIERLPNGIWIFKFGKREGEEAVVNLQIHGSLKMNCLRRSCRTLNTLNFFPNTINPEQEELDKVKS